MAQAVAAPPAPVPGVETLDERGVRAQRIAVLILTVLPFLGLVAGIVLLWGRGITGVDLGLMVGMYTVACLGVTVGYHRLLTHKSFRALPWVKVTLAVAGSLAIQGSVIAWVADHRRHHAYADQPGDPHSPHLEEGPGIRGALKGLWHAHIGWLFKAERTVIERWAPDMLRDPSMVRVTKLFPLLVVVSLALPAVLGWALTGTLLGAVSGFIWGGLVRAFVLHHSTWSINSICHFYGRRPYETTDKSTNNWMLALISMGESWHNNHHAFPTSAVHGLGRFQVDPTGAVIRTLERLRLASDVRIPTPDQIAGRSIG